MKAVLEFDLPEDREELQLAQMAGAMHSSLFEIDELLRRMLKYESEQYTDAQLFIIQKIRNDFNDLLKENGVEL